MRVKLMTRYNKNPWENMTESSQRRIDSETLHNLFWITDLQGNYGFCLRRNRIFERFENTVSLKGISILKRNSQYGFGELFLILNKKEDWQIFYALCEDIVTAARRYDSEDQMIGAVEVRLKRWQQLLKQERKQDMTLEKQMGLFAELLCLRDIIAQKAGIRQAVFSWVGPEFDKQDFLIADAVIEVKSYRTSKGAVVHITSLNQLHSEKEPLFLVSYGLTPSDDGLTVEDVVHNIKELLEEDSPDTIDIFENKLMEYGYIPEISENPLYQFIVDKRRAFFVSDEFPKIFPCHIKSQITSVIYCIDLSKCSEYEVMIDSFLNGTNNHD
jgi:hypothetical protein